ncbi:Mur ligase family protein [Vibrio renipiscarius]|uniref:UDP-N-acetylmuramoylalanyl-D-glutamate--2, 6-diaminopimelate ligase n=1 Tax=Vibrio renipiscarius TaxID=1461322 RepID=A0A0C2NUK8_9VIBR|nr:UDP-N-acetylmuramoyl-L-alanyl-D-glutamate--2,6-diaminopimelate ligase [Vibrio renipiscarius]KII76623.1 UDP-N-acetylmuramoylalanyl-D-glutamate--2,6-diaminopimelate ligase [Vibrio renipiscarius]KII77857.1 UDP-N-acetylmuramoylalanyl-D-glutamate--2,6-diaminopimelate ligase [Vibrio renipiscarius]
MRSPAISAHLELLESLNVNQFKTNSSEVTQGDVFICRQGNSVDSHEFAEEALVRGASALIANRTMNLPIPVIITESYYQSLALVKAFYRHPHLRLKHVGVTGTNGKTTVSDCLNQILNRSCRSAYIGTLGAKIADLSIPLENTTPDGATLLNLFNEMGKLSIDFNIMELSSHALSQDRAGFVSLQVGVITNIGHDHLDYHKTKDSYVQAKLQLIDRIKPQGTLVVNLNDPHADAAIARAAQRVNMLTFAIENSHADLNATQLVSTLQGTRFDLVFGQDRMTVNSPMPFDYNVENVLAIVAVLLSMGWTLEAAGKAIESLKMPDGRAQFIELSNGATGLVDYAHNSDGLRSLLKNVRAHAANRLVVVMGVTGDRIRQASAMGEICSKYADLVIFTSDNPMGTEQNVLFRALTSLINDTPRFEISDRAEAIKLAKQLSERGDLIVVCGKGNETFQYFNDGKGKKHRYIGDLAVLQHSEVV